LIARVVSAGVAAALMVPVIAGLAGVVLPAAGYLPALGHEGFSLAPIRAVLEWPGLGASAMLSAKVGVLSTLLALSVTYLITAAVQDSALHRRVLRLTAPLLAIPHAAAALGLAFLLAPSGWITRMVAPLAGFERPPDWLSVNDPGGWALIAGLVAKEVPFLMLMTLAALPQIEATRRLTSARALGYGRMTGWFKAVLPALHARIRLPVLAVLAYGLSVVDMALILGPSLPPTLAVQVTIWMSAPDLGLRLDASALALVQLAIVGAVLAVWVLAERALARPLRGWAANGARGRGPEPLLRGLGLAAGAAVLAALGLGALGLALWSVAGAWRFPDLLPASYGLAAWRGQSAQVSAAAFTTVAIAASVALVALGMALAAFEAAARRGLPARLGPAVWLPLLVPQVAFVPGLATLSLILGLEPTAALVAMGHLVFVLPYVMLALAGPWNGWDGRAGLAGAALGAGPWRVFWALRLPMLSRALAAAAAVGFATSIAQYLPTVMLGAGRVVTLTTEAVALSSGLNRRVIGVWALAQMVAPWAAFALALVLPGLIWRNRRGV
jgi:putative thiamine transport system permease protein